MQNNPFSLDHMIGSGTAICQHVFKRTESMLQPINGAEALDSGLKMGAVGLQVLLSLAIDIRLMADVYRAQMAVREAPKVEDAPGFAFEFDRTLGAADGAQDL